MQQLMRDSLISGTHPLAIGRDLVYITFVPEKFTNEHRNLQRLG